MKLIAPIAFIEGDIVDGSYEDCTIFRTVLYDVSFIAPMNDGDKKLTEINTSAGTIVCPMPIKEVEKAIDYAMEVGEFDLWKQWKEQQTQNT